MCAVLNSGSFTERFLLFLLFLCLTVSMSDRTKGHEADSVVAHESPPHFDSTSEAAPLIATYTHTHKR